MRWRKLSLLLVLVLLLLAATAWGFSEVKVEVEKNSVTLAETASFKLTITNEAKEKQRYSLFSLVQGWTVEPSPLKNKIMEIEPGETKTTIIKATPKESFNPGIYGLDLNIETDLGEKYSEALKIYISPEKLLDYLPSIKVTPEMDQNINPQEPQSIKLLLENKNPLNMPELVIKLQSDIPEFNKEIATSLSPLEKKYIEFAVVPDFFQKPGEFFLFFTFEKNGEVVKVISQKIEILAITSEFKIEQEDERTFLRYIRTLSVKNTGNVKNSQKVTLPVSFWGNLFTSSTAETVKEDGQRYLSWELDLSPNEAVTLVATKDYRPLFYFLVVLAALAIIYLIIKSPISLKKTAVSQKHDASLSELKVTLHIRNLSKKPVRELEVIDLVPGIADIDKNLDIGTLKPQEIKHTKKGTIVKWNLMEIEAKEDRLISYKIKSALKIVGTLKLPRAKAIYGTKRKKTTYSNYFKISSRT